MFDSTVNAAPAKVVSIPPQQTFDQICQALRTLAARDILPTEWHLVGNGTFNSALAARNNLKSGFNAPVVGIWPMVEPIRLGLGEKPLHFFDLHARKIETLHWQFRVKGRSSITACEDGKSDKTFFFRFCSVDESSRYYPEYVCQRQSILDSLTELRNSGVGKTPWIVCGALLDLSDGTLNDKWPNLEHGPGDKISHDVRRGIGLGRFLPHEAECRIELEDEVLKLHFRKDQAATKQSTMIWDTSSVASSIVSPDLQKPPYTTTEYAAIKLYEILKSIKIGARIFLNLGDGLVKENGKIYEGLLLLSGSRWATKDRTCQVGADITHFGTAEIHKISESCCHLILPCYTKTGIRYSLWMITDKSLDALEIYPTIDPKVRTVFQDISMQLLSKILRTSAPEPKSSLVQFSDNILVPECATGIVREKDILFVPMTNAGAADSQEYLKALRLAADLGITDIKIISSQPRQKNGLGESDNFYRVRAILADKVTLIYQPLEELIDERIKDENLACHLKALLLTAEKLAKTGDEEKLKDLLSEVEKLAPVIELGANGGSPSLADEIAWQTPLVDQLLGKISLRHTFDKALIRYHSRSETQWHESFICRVSFVIDNLPKEDPLRRNLIQTLEERYPGFYKHIDIWKTIVEVHKLEELPILSRKTTRTSDPSDQASSRDRKSPPFSVSAFSFGDFDFKLEIRLKELQRTRFGDRSYQPLNLWQRFGDAQPEQPSSPRVEQPELYEFKTIDPHKGLVRPLRKILDQLEASKTPLSNRFELHVIDIVRTVSIAGRSDDDYQKFPPIAFLKASASPSGALGRLTLPVLIDELTNLSSFYGVNTLGEVTSTMDKTKVFKRVYVSQLIEQLIRLNNIKQRGATNSH